MRKLYPISLILLLFISCSKEEIPEQKLPVNEYETVNEYGTVKYVVEPATTPFFVTFLNKNKEEETVYVTDTNYWEYSFQAKTDDLVYVIVNNSFILSPMFVGISYNNEYIGSKGCSNGGNSYSACWIVKKIP